VNNYNNKIIWNFQNRRRHSSKGDITPQGAKNEALQILCAVLRLRKVIINNIPDIIDINKLITLLGNLGVKIQKNGPGSYTFQADDVNVGYLRQKLSKRRWFFTRFYNDCWPFISSFWKRVYQNQVEIKLDVGLDRYTFRRFYKPKFRYNREDHFYGVEAKTG
jgi:UDP-N-acetylglucosamine 1-carboxyvinyltransferase